MIDRVHFAFRAENGVYTAAHSTHAVSVDAGVLRVTPYNRPDEYTVQSGSPMSLETSAIYRGDDLLDSAYQGASIDPATGRLEIARGLVGEEVRNHEDGVEQSWRFEAEPGSQGDLVVEVTVSGLGYLGATDGGLHFGAPGQLGLRYSHATWIGADGVSVPIAAEYTNGAIRLTVSDDVLSGTRFPAVLDPVAGAEIAMDQPVIGWTGAGARRSAIARNEAGTQFLVAWQDDRNGQSDIFGTRVGANGEVLDPLGIAISEDTGTQDNPAIAFANGNYVVAWQEAGNIRAARVTPGAGAVTALGNVAASGAQETLPRLASGGDRALLVYQSNEDVSAALFNGTDFSATFSVTATAAAELEPAVAADPAGGFLVTWTEGEPTTGPDLRGRLVTDAGVPSGLAFDISAAEGGQSQSAASFAGGNYVVVWSNNSNGVDIYGTRVSTAGAVLDTRVEGTLTVGGVQLSAGPSSETQPDVACGTSGCLIAWTDRRNAMTSGFDVFAQLLNADLTASGGEFALSAAGRNQRAPVLTTSASGYTASWHDDRHGGPDAVFVARVGSAGGVTDPDGILVVSGNNRQNSPTVAENNSRWLTAWSDSASFGADIRGLRVGFNGANVDTVARPIAAAPGQQGTPDAARLGTNYIVVWEDARGGVDDDIFAARVDTNGVVLDASGISVSTALGDQLSPEVATDGVSSLVVWQDRRAGNFDVFAALIDGSGAVVAADIPVCQADGNQVRPSVAYDPVNAMYLVAWQSTPAGTGADTDVVGARVTAAGSVLDPCGVPIAAAASAQLNPDVIFGGGRFFVTWEDRRNESLGDIFGARVTVSATGVTVLDANGIPIATATGSQAESVATFSQSSYLVAWTDGRQAGLNSTDIFGAQVSTGGLPGPNFVIANTPETESVPAVASSLGGSNDSVLVVYARHVPELDTTRVFHRRITSTRAGGTTCTTNAQCETGFCVDGRCCDTACGGNNQGDCQACSTRRGAAVDGICSPVPAGRICRNYADTFCDLRELCDGTSVDCPVDVGRREGVVCDSACGSVCPANDVTGAPHVCPDCPL